MIQKINFKFAINSMLAISAMAILFQLLVIVGIIPYGIVWGGRLENRQQMLVFETVSISLNLLTIFVIATKGGYMKKILPGKIITVILWIFIFLFSLNTLGNIFSKATLETIVFTPLTFFSAIMCYRIAIQDSLAEREVC